MTSEPTKSRSGLCAPTARGAARAATTLADPRHAAVRQRDARADGRFVYGVRTTGVFCHPSCSSRAARPENIEFFADAAAARGAGYRACLRCEPDLVVRNDAEALLVAKLCRHIESTEVLPSLTELAAIAGRSPDHVRRLVRRVTGLTPHAYAREVRAMRMRAALEEGNTVTAALHRTGYGSSGRFYEEAVAVLGMAPRARRGGGRGLDIEVAVGASSLGQVLVAWTAVGVCAVALGEDEGALRAELARSFPHAHLSDADPAGAAFLAEVVHVVEHPRVPATFPLDLQGTAFQMRVWRALRDIAPGEVITYADLARRLGRPEAVRAVAGACAQNKAALVVPCHRVVRGDGSLAGYRWGLTRKRALLEREGAPTSPSKRGP